MHEFDEVAFELARRARRRKRPRKPRLRASGMAPQPEPVSITQQSGSQAEQQALAYLQERGLECVASNLRCRAGEIDLIMLEAGVLVFVEVRARCSDRYGGAAASVDLGKRRKLLRAAAYFLSVVWRGPTLPCRFDVVAFEPHGCLWLRDAFRDDVR